VIEITGNLLYYLPVHRDYLAAMSAMTKAAHYTPRALLH
jgi:hypothetical protein